MSWFRSHTQASFGAVLVRLGYVTQEQVQEAKVYQRRDFPALKLGEVLVRLGFLTEGQVKEALAHQRKQRSRRAAEAMASLVEAQLDVLFPAHATRR